MIPNAVHEYRGYVVVKTHQRQFLHGRYFTEGYCICGPNGVQYGPGACVSTSIDGACKVIDDMILAGAEKPGDKLDASLFWSLHGQSGLSVTVGRGCEAVSITANSELHRTAGRVPPKVKVLEGTRADGKPTIMLDGGVFAGEWDDAQAALDAANAIIAAARHVLDKKL